MTQPILKLDRVLQAPRQIVFDSWTSPEALKQWHCGTVVESIMDLRPGGQFLIRFAPDDQGKVACVRGEYREVVVPERLSYTWSWDSSDWESLVMIEFVDLGHQTQMKITHERLESSESCEGHQQGWAACLDGLQAYCDQHHASFDASH